MVINDLGCPLGFVAQIALWKIVRKGTIVDRAYKALQKLGKVGFGHHLAFEHRFATE